MKIWTVPKIWENQECWLLGGGTSLIEQFQIPNNIVDSVRTGELAPVSYSPYMESIQEKNVIGVNMAMFFGNWVDIGFFGDNKFYNNYKQYFQFYKGLLIGCAPVLSKTVIGADPPAAFVKYLKISSTINGISTNPSYVNWNRNSGGAAISLCHHLGVKRIILVGFDMSLDEKRQMHWHNIYPQWDTLPFGSHIIGFKQIAIDAERLGIEIINASPKSKITQFRKASVKDLI